MIGGKDIVIPATGDSAALDICARIVRCYWQQARFEDAVTGEKYQEYADVPLGLVHELLVYRDAQAECAWDADDTNSPENSMLYFLLSRDSVTVVVDNPDNPDMRSVLGSLRDSLESAIHRTYAAAA